MSRRTKLGDWRALPFEEASRPIACGRALSRGDSRSSRACRRPVPIVDTAAPHLHHRAVGRGFSRLLSRNGCETHWMRSETVPI
jgi:hypothetical protein